MAEYQLTPDAEADLLAIASYTIKTWGIDQARRYETTIRNCFNAIGGNGIRSRALLEARSEIRFTRCEHHYVFFQVRAGQGPLIVGILHQHMDLVRRLRHRLDV